LATIIFATAPWRHWLKWLVVGDLHRQLLLAQKAHAGPTNDGDNLHPLIDNAHGVSAIGPVLAATRCSCP
jgi:hypothetical protein